MPEGDLSLAMDAEDLAIRNATFQLFVDLGRAPTTDEVATVIGTTEPSVRSGWERLHQYHALVLDAAGELRMANPFSARPTDFTVRATGRSWFANCAWDAFGIGAALHVDSKFDTHCPDCHAAIHVSVRESKPDDESLVFHVLVPATQWWNDIGFT